MDSHGDDTEVTGSGYRRPWLLYAVAAVLAVAVALGALTRWTAPGGPPSTASSGTSPTASRAASPSPGPTASPLDRLPSLDAQLLPDAGPWTPVERRHPVRGENAGAGCDYDAPGLVIAGAWTDGRAWGRSCTSGRDARSIVIRSTADGSFARHSAVLTFPVGRDLGADGTPETRHGVRGWWTPHSVAWWVGDDLELAVVRGDLPAARLTDIARAFRIGELGELHLDRVPGLRVDHHALYRSPVHHEASYTATAVHERDALGTAQVLTKVVAGAAIEDRLLAAGARPAAAVHGHPAVFVRTHDNAVVAWELSEGIVAVVAAHGVGPTADAEPALHRLAERAATVSSARWDQPDWEDVRSGHATETSPAAPR
ncbi:MAG TPA: hypothetical protein VFJ12_00530 [Segeticoccus sp.]|nr:hypothetical protein [Segeticoccus sp.]